MELEDKREVEVEGIDEGKVLLCNVGGKVSALGSKCTHYGAPMVKGVLTGMLMPKCDLKANYCECRFRIWDFQCWYCEG